MALPDFITSLSREFMESCDFFCNSIDDCGRNGTGRRDKHDLRDSLSADSLTEYGNSEKIEKRSHPFALPPVDQAFVDSFCRYDDKHHLGRAASNLTVAPSGVIDVPSFWIPL
jgi:hypothetical protein